MPDQHLLRGNLCNPKDQAVSVKKKKEDKAKHVEMCVISN